MRKLLLACCMFIISHVVCRAQESSALGTDTSNSEQEEFHEVGLDGTIRNPVEAHRTTLGHWNVSVIARHLEECGLWLAPSTIQNSGLGLYAGTNLDLGGAGDVLIPLYYARGGDLKVFEDYIWVTDDLAHLGFRHATGVFTPGLGAATNGIFVGSSSDNIQLGIRSARCEESQDEFLKSPNSANPGFGAYAAYQCYGTSAKREIAAGEELFLDYGFRWFRIPQKSKKNLEAKAIEDSGKRTLAWLYNHGSCADHLYGGTSTLAYAGRGAFAKRNLPAGATVAVSPLIIIVMKRSGLIMSQSRLEHVDQNGSQKLPKKQQELLLNYCYGHNESSLLLLCPYGAGVNFLNHNATRANVKIEWGMDKAPLWKNFNHPKSFVEPLDSWIGKVKLSFHFIATRDIAKDEEVLLNYGDAWEQAWQAHVESWKPELSKQPEEYLSMSEFTLRYADPLNALKNIKILECSAYFRSQERESTTNQTFFLEKAIQENEWFPCKVLSMSHVSSGDTLEYTVVALDAKTNSHDNNILHNIPPMAVRIPFTPSSLVKNAFRHEIGIPDRIFPQAWRNHLQT